jgi:hypothetical protein
MSSQDFPTYGRGDEPPEEPEHPVVPPAEPYGRGQYGQRLYGEPPNYAPTHGGHGEYGGPPPPQYGPQAQRYGPPAYGQGGRRPFPPPGSQTFHGTGQPAITNRTQVQRSVEPNPQAARMALLGGVVAGFYGLLVLTIQRTALREIAQAPGSELNHPLRTDVIDAIGQLAVTGLTAVALTLWIRDVLVRRRQGKSPVVAELVAFVLMSTAAVFLLIWALIVGSTGFGSVDDTTDRLPTAYGYGGFGLWLLAAGLLIGYYKLRPDMVSVVQSGPNRPPWDQ